MSLTFKPWLGSLRPPWLAFTIAITLSFTVPSEAAQQADARKKGKTFHEELRVQMLLNSGWRFKRQSAPEAAVEPEFVGAEKFEYDDSSWSVIHLPHTWDATPESTFVTTGHFRGLGWYRREFNLPAKWQSRRVWLEFKGVFQIAEVWVNGRYLGQHVGGYTGFEFDITNFLKWDATNLLAVRVNDVISPDIAPANETNVADYGGIHRSVKLTITDAAYIVAGRQRVTTERSGNVVQVRARTAYINPGLPARSIRLENSILNAEGQRVGTQKEFVVTESGQIFAFFRHGQFPRLTSGLRTILMFTMWSARFWKATELSTALSPLLGFALWTTIRKRVLC